MLKYLFTILIFTNAGHASTDLPTANTFWHLGKINCMGSDVPLYFSQRINFGEIKANHDSCYNHGGKPCMTIAMGIKNVANDWLGLSSSYNGTISLAKVSDYFEYQTSGNWSRLICSNGGYNNSSCFNATPPPYGENRFDRMAIVNGELKAPSNFYPTCSDRIGRIGTTSPFVDVADLTYSQVQTRRPDFSNDKIIWPKEIGKWKLKSLRCLRDGKEITTQESKTLEVQQVNGYSPGLFPTWYALKTTRVIENKVCFNNSKMTTISNIKPTGNAADDMPFIYSFELIDSSNDNECIANSEGSLKYIISAKDNLVLLNEWNIDCYNISGIGDTEATYEKTK